MPVWLHPLHSVIDVSRFQPHKLVASSKDPKEDQRSRGEKLHSCLKSLLDSVGAGVGAGVVGSRGSGPKSHDISRSNVVDFVDGEVVTKFSPTGVDFTLPLLCTDVMWTRAASSDLQDTELHTHFDRAETEEMPDVKFLIGLAPRWKWMQMAALESFDDPQTDEVWVLCASFQSGTPEMDSFLQAMERSGALRWDIDEQYVFHRQVIGRGSLSLTRRGLLRRSFRGLASLVDEQSHSEEELDSVPCEPAAMKIMKHPDADEEAQSIVNEVRFLAESATHPNIVKLNGTFCVKWRSKSLWLLALELCSGGRLQDHVRVYGQLERASGECASIALLSAVAHLHARRVLHRDIRPQNILLEKLRPVLVNFGNACRFEDASATLLRSRVDGYTAPEIADARLGAQGPASDVFSVAASILFLLTGIEPFGEVKCTQQTLTGNPRLDELAANRLCESTASLLRRLLAWHARKRPTACQACMMLHEEASEEVTELPICEQAMAALSSTLAHAAGGSQSGLASIDEIDDLEELVGDSLSGAVCQTQGVGHALDFEAFRQRAQGFAGPAGGYAEPGPPASSAALPPAPGGQAAELVLQNMGSFTPQPPSSPSPRKRAFSGRVLSIRSGS